MPVDLSGTWTEVQYDGWYNMMKTLGVDPDRLPADLRMTEKITQTGEGAIQVVATNNKDPSYKKEVTVTVGSRFTDDIRGKPFECDTFWEGDKLVFQGVAGRGRVTRELLDGRMVATVTIGDEVATTVFEKQG